MTPNNFYAYSVILVSLSNQGKSNPEILSQVGDLMEDIPTFSLPLEAVLQIRNNTVAYNEHRVDIISALETRALGLLYKYSKTNEIELQLKPPQKT